jgi:hypothetical protein
MVYRDAGDRAGSLEVYDKRASTTKARPPEGLKGRRAGGDTTATGNLYIASKALGSLKCIGFDISSMVGG